MVAGFESTHLPAYRTDLAEVHGHAECWAELLPAARHVWVDTAEHHAGSPAHQDYVGAARPIAR